MDYKVIFKAISGSHLYGTARPDSDTDIRGICLPPMKSLLGLSKFEQHEVSGEDTVIYSLQKFARLALKANPNILEMLFVPPDAIQYTNEYGETLLKNRGLFLSTRVVHTYSGYAFSQLKRIKRHRDWLENSPIKPTLREFGGVMIMGQARFISQYRHDSYRAAYKRWMNYQTWKKNRNPARAALEERYGYDVKHACHLVRLLCQCKDILTAPSDFSPRLAGSSLRMVQEVLSGQWEYEALIEWAQNTESMLHQLVEQSSLPRKPNFKRVEEMIMRILRHYIVTGGRT